MAVRPIHCPDCDENESLASRRDFLRVAGATALAATVGPRLAFTEEAFAEEAAAAATVADPESKVKLLFDSLSDSQKRDVCFGWDFQDEAKKRGLLRTRISNNWQITDHTIESDFYTGEQRELIRKIFEGIIHPDWHGRIEQQLKDDAGGYGKAQSIAIFGQPGRDKFEFVMTGRHMTIRCDGNSADHVAFGGPIFYGHAAQGFHEKADHPGNVFWPQAVAANELYKMLDGKQQKSALVVEGMPREEQVGFRVPDGGFLGIPVTELSGDQKGHLQQVLAKLVEPYRQTDREEALACLQTQGGLDACRLAFFQQNDIGADGVWDNWRLEGPSFVWHFRGSPHVHVWVNVADNPAVQLNA